MVSLPLSHTPAALTALPVSFAAKPTQVQTRSSDTLPRGPEGLDAHSFQHDNEQANKIIHMQHREALRLALGSILSPKRPPNSRSTSGTASPAHIYYSTHPHSPYPPPPPHSTPAQAESTSHYLLPPQGHLISHSHTPSRLCQSDSATDFLSSSQVSPRSSPGPDSPILPPSPTSTGSPAIHAPAPSGTGTPNKAKFIETLQSKSAWDALIHGPFS